MCFGLFPSTFSCLNNNTKNNNNNNNNNLLGYYYPLFVSAIETALLTVTLMSSNTELSRRNSNSKQPQSPSSSRAFSLDDFPVFKQLNCRVPTCVDDYLSLLQTYQMELDVHNPSGRLPGCFVREFGESLLEYVMLRDPNHNEFEVHVVKKGDEMYFDEGWLSLKDVYCVCFGAWVTLTYVSPRLLTIRLLTRWGTEVTYPCYDPPLRHLLARSGPNGCIGSSVLSWCLPDPARLKSLIRSYVKELTAFDVQSGCLILPFYGFGQPAFAFVFSDLILIDNAGKQYPCNFQFGVDDVGELACRISGGWVDLCRAHEVTEGDRVKFSVGHYSVTNVMYVSVYPRILLEDWLSL